MLEVMSKFKFILILPLLYHAVNAAEQQSGLHYYGTSYVRDQSPSITTSEAIKSASPQPRYILAQSRTVSRPIMIDFLPGRQQPAVVISRTTPTNGINPWTPPSVTTSSTPPPYPKSPWTITSNADPSPSLTVTSNSELINSYRPWQSTQRPYFPTTPTQTHIINATISPNLIIMYPGASAGTSIPPFLPSGTGVTSHITGITDGQARPTVPQPIQTNYPYPQSNTFQTTDKPLPALVSSQTPPLSIVSVTRPPPTTPWTISTTVTEPPTSPLYTGSQKSNEPETSPPNPSVTAQQNVLFGPGHLSTNTSVPEPQPEQVPISTLPGLQPSPITGQTIELQPDISSRPASIILPVRPTPQPIPNPISQPQSIPISEPNFVSVPQGELPLPPQHPLYPNITPRPVPVLISQPTEFLTTTTPLSELQPVSAQPAVPPISFVTQETETRLEPHPIQIPKPNPQPAPVLLPVSPPTPYPNIWPQPPQPTLFPAQKPIDVRQPPPPMTYAASYPKTTDFVCREAYGYYPVTNECDTYIECKQGIAVKQSCPDGLHFKSSTQWPDYPCAYPSDVQCTSGSIKQYANPTAECPHEYGFYPLKESNCSNYIMCHEGKPTIMHCPYGLAFNFDKNSCDWPENVPACNVDAFKNFTCPTPPINEVGDLSDTMHKYRYGNSCSFYIVCHRGYPRLLSCDPGLSFDQESESCIDSALVPNCNMGQK